MVFNSVHCRKLLIFTICPCFALSLSLISVKFDRDPNEIKMNLIYLAYSSRYSWILAVFHNYLDCPLIWMIIGCSGEIQFIAEETISLIGVYSPVNEFDHLKQKDRKVQKEI